MSVDAACTPCCCEPTTTCCACPGTEVRIRINNTNRERVIANSSIVLYDNIETFQADIRFRVMTSSCYGLPPAGGFITVQDLGSSWSIMQVGKLTHFYGMSHVERVGSDQNYSHRQPDCRPCLTPYQKRDFTKTASASFGNNASNYYQVICRGVNCPCTTDFAGNFWHIDMYMNAPASVSGLQSGYPFINRYASLYGSASHCLSSNTFVTSVLGIGTPGIGEGGGLDASPDISLHYPVDFDQDRIPRECRHLTSFRYLAPTGLFCSQPTGGDVGEPSVLLIGSGSLTSKKNLGCARYVCLAPHPFTYTIYECDCTPGVNTMGQFQYQTIVSQNLSVSTI